MSLADARAQFAHLRDYSDQELLDFAAAQYRAEPGSPQYQRLQSELLGYDRSAGRAVTDAGVGLAQGVTGLGQMVGTIGGALIPGVKAFDNPVTNKFRGWTEDLNQYKSTGLRNREAGAAIEMDIAQRAAEARGEGFGEQLLSGAAQQARIYGRNPSLAVQDLVSNVPQLLAGGAVGRGVSFGLRAAGAGASTAARAGVAAGIGSGGALQGADAGGDAYQRLRAAGVSDDEATDLATSAALKSGAASIALSALPGAATIERSLIPGAATPRRFGLGRTGTAIRTGLTEAATEGVDEGYGQFAGNQAMAAVDPNTNLAAGVGQAAAQGIVASGPLGFVAGRESAAPAPRTATGEIDLTGANVYDEPAYQRRGLDPLNERSSPWPGPAPRTMADLSGTATPSVQTEPAQYTSLVEPTASLPADPYAMDPLRAQPPRPAPRQPVEGQGDGTIVVTPEGTALPAQTSEQMARVEQYRRLPQNDIGGGPGVPSRGAVLAALQEANTELGKSVVRKDGQLAATRGTAPLREVLEADNPVEAMRALYADGSATRDELLDTWHRKLTGQSIDEAKAAPMLNSAGFVAEPPEQVAAQLVAVREGRKPVVVLGVGEDANQNVEGLERGEATDPTTGQVAIVYGADPAAVQRAVARTAEVGLKQAMGEAQGVVDPTATTTAGENPVAVQQVDDATGQVLADQIVPEARVGEVAPIAGTTARVVPAGQPVADRIAATAPKVKAPKYGRRSSPELVDIAENTKDDAEYTEARYELYRRWANDTDEGTAHDYLTDSKNKSALTDAEKESFGARYQAELEKKAAARSRAMAKKFGVDLGGEEAVAESVGGANPDNGTDPLTVEQLAGVSTGADAIRWMMDNATDPWHREIAARLAPYVGDDVGVRFVKAGDNVPSLVARHLNANAKAVLHLIGDRANAYYRADSLDETTLLHEQLHAATMRALSGDNNPELRSEMRRLLGTIRESFRKAAVTNTNGQEAAWFDRVLTDENELVAYAFSSPSMRRWMQNMNADGEFITNEKSAAELRRKAERRAPGVPPLTMWQRFTDALRRLFGIPPRNQLAFERMMADREDEIAGVVEAGKDTELYNRLDELLQRALDAQAGSSPTSGVAVDARASEGEPPRLVKPFTDAAKSVASYTKAMTSGKEINPALLSMMTLRQINEQYGKNLPALRDWTDAIMERSAKASKLAAEADRVALQWEQSVKNADDRKALADVLLRASQSEVSLDNSDPEYLATLSPAQRTEWTVLNDKLRSLPPEAQQARKQALDVLSRQWEYTRNALESFINHTVSDPGLRAQRIADLRQEFGRNRGDYFPLSRFGDRVVVGHGAARDGRDVISFHESAASADQEAKRLKDAGARKVTVTLNTERDPRQRATTGFIGSLHAMIDGSDADAGVKDSLHEALQQLYLKSLPELSGAKHLIRRENIEGFSQDALRVFADAVTRGSRYAAQLEAAPKVQAAQEAAESQSLSTDKRNAAVVIGRKEGAEPVVRVVAPGTERLRTVDALEQQGYTTEFFNTVPESAKERLTGALDGATDQQIDDYAKQVGEVVGRADEGVEDMRAAKALYNHMIKLQRTESNADPSPITEALGQAGYTWYLGFSPAFWAMNTLQNPMIGIPQLGSKYGVAKAAGEWMNAAKWFGGVRMGKLLNDRKTPFSVEWLKEQAKDGNLKGISKDELDMLQKLEDRQVLDFTQAMDLSRIGQASSDKRYKFMRLAAAGAHHTEVFNRVTFALAAYRLAKKSDGNVSHEDAVRRAENDLAATHFDYSYANKPELMRGKTSRLLFMFQQYRQHMLYWWAKNIKDAVKNENPGDRKRALKAALLMGTTNLIFAGAAGLPFVGAVGFLANLLADDEDEPFDFQRWITDAATEATGDPKSGEVLAKGIFAGLGANVSQRIGQADILPFLNEGAAKYERNADDKMRAYLFDLAGPLGSIALNMARASEAFGRGDTMTGLAASTPKAASDIIKAFQLDQEGMKDKRGQTLATADSFDSDDKMLTALGVTPTKVANLKADRGRIIEADNALRERTRKITSQFVQAWLRGDQDGMRDSLEDVQKFNATLAKNKIATRDTMITGRTLEAAVKDYQQRALLLAVSGGSAETKRQLIMALQLQGLNNPVTVEGIQQNAANLPGLPGLPGSQPR